MAALTAASPSIAVSPIVIIVREMGTLAAVGLTAWSVAVATAAAVTVALLPTGRSSGLLSLPPLSLLLLFVEISVAIKSLHLQIPIVNVSKTCKN
jgi:hypothetical protein